MTDPSAANPGADVPRPEESPVFPTKPLRLTRPSEPKERTLRSLLEEGLPEPPLQDFEDIHGSLEAQLARSRRERDEQQARLLQHADQLVRDLYARLGAVEAQLRQLEQVRDGFDELGEFGTDGLREVESHLGRLRAYRDGLRSVQESPALLEARNGLRESLRRERDAIVSRLDHDSLREEMEPVVDEILAIVEAADAEWARRALDSFENDVREWRRFHHLPVIHRFWNGLSHRLEEVDAAGAEIARERASALDEEITRRDELKAVNELARRDALRIREAVVNLGDRGPEETKVQMHVWLGRLRKYQDEFDLDDGVKKEVYLTFGSINRARKHLGVEGFIDALNRNFRSDWDEYVRHWEMRLESARVQDRLDAEEDERLEREREERERLSAEERAQSEERLAEITTILQELSSGAGWRVDPDLRDDVKEMLLAAVDQGGCQNEEFLGAARAFASLAHGADFRKLRRSLAKRGVDFDEVELVEPERADSPDDELFRKLAPSWRGKTIAIVGGLPREQVRRRIAEGLGLKEARWYEYYRTTCEQEQAETAIRSGAVDLVLLLIRYAGHKINEIKETARSCGVECRVIDRGCGVTSILRGLESAGPVIPRS